MTGKGVGVGVCRPPRLTLLVMVDTVLLRLPARDARGVDFIEETAAYLQNPAEHWYSEGGTCITGKLDGLSFSCTDRVLKLNGGSLCKWQLGDNYSDMGRRDIEQAVERLSDTLHVDMSRAQVTRLDVGHSIITKHPTDVYLSHLGEYQRARRLVEPHTLYYDTRDERLAFYDKNREQRATGGKVPELYAGRNVLRYERRFTKHLPAHLQVDEVTAATLYNEQFYIALLKSWAAGYMEIAKINDIQLNCTQMTGKKDLYRQAVRGLVERLGGEVAMLQQLTDAQKRGEISAKTACDLKQAVKDACKADGKLVVPSEAISELDAKIKEAVRFYR